MTKKTTRTKKKLSPPNLLKALLEARSPSGAEYEAQKVLEKTIKPLADEMQKDSMGNRFFTLNKQGSPSLMLAGHMDELAFIVSYVDDKGFIYFETIGGHDTNVISGRRVSILSSKGVIPGVTGKRAVHLLSPEERKKSPEVHKIWIDIGCESKEETLSKISIGDLIIYEHSFSVLANNRATARAFDNKAGCYVVMETLARVAKNKRKLSAKLTSVATVQEEIGVRGAISSSFSVNPDVAIAVDVSHATDHPDCDLKKFGEFHLGGGPIIAKGPNINPIVYEQLVECAKKLKIPYQIGAESRPTGTDARAIQTTRNGVPTGLISLPLRYMHTPSEVMDLNDIENAVKLLTEFTLSLKKNQSFDW